MYLCTRKNMDYISEVIRLRIRTHEFCEGFFNIARQSISQQLNLQREWSDFHENPRILGQGSFRWMLEAIWIQESGSGVPIQICLFAFAFFSVGWFELGCQRLSNWLHKRPISEMTYRLSNATQISATSARPQYRHMTRIMQVPVLSDNPNTGRSDAMTDHTRRSCRSARRIEIATLSRRGGALYNATWSSEAKSRPLICRHCVYAAPALQRMKPAIINLHSVRTLSLHRRIRGHLWGDAGSRKEPQNIQKSI